MNSNSVKNTALTALLAAGSVGLAQAQESIPSVVVTVENLTHYNGTFLTPPWVGFHNGQIDVWTGGTLASSLPIEGSDALERLAEDGNTGPLARDFAILVPNGVDGTITSNGPIPPFGPGQISSQLFEVDPAESKYFSFATMIIPSNDAFIATGNPVGTPVFDDAGNFIATPFSISANGMEVNDAGTEVNDEIPANTAFFGQQAPNTGVDQGDVIRPHEGFLPASAGGILADPMFAEGDFLQPDYGLVRFNFTYLDKAAPVLFTGDLSPMFEFPNPSGAAGASGRTFFFLDDAGESLVYFVFASGLTGDITAAHLHLAPLTQNGPVVLPLQPAFGRFAFGRITADAVAGPLGGGDLDKLIAEIVSGATYVNIHTAANPAGEVRAQVYPLTN